MCFSLPLKVDKAKLPPQLVTNRPKFKNQMLFMSFEGITNIMELLVAVVPQPRPLCGTMPEQLQVHSCVKKSPNYDKLRGI